MGYNKVIIEGRLTHDPELRQTPNGKIVCRFSVAVNRDENHTDFIACTAFAEKAEFIYRYFFKGKPVLVEGRLNSEKWTDKNGNNRETLSVLCDRVQFTESDKTERGAQKPAESAKDEPRAENSSQRGHSAQPFEPLDENADDLPF